jgi:diphthine-ammonia ligase
MSYFCSWSGGKDCCLAMHRYLQAGQRIDLLLTMMCEDGERSRSHGLTKEMLMQQAQALGIPWKGIPTTWSNYESHFLTGLKGLQKQGFRYGIFGDIDLQDHLTWVQTVCQKGQIIPLHPIWKRERKDLLLDIFAHNFQPMIIAVKEGVLSRDFLGKIINASLMRDLEKAGIDLCGENGEYHTLMTDGPCFSFPLKYKLGDICLRDGVWFLDVA